jgi:hypothetical protein
MQKIVDQITDHLVGLITADKPAYNPTELLKAGIPSFVVERIRLYLEDKVKEDIGQNESEWFDGESKLVLESWKDYIRSAISTSHIPKDSLYKVLNAVVKDIIYVFIEPRKNMAEYVFREDESLSYDEVETRCARLTIYKHFGTAIPLYMKKRNLEELTKERCKQLIHKLDAKLVASYSAQDWAQKLEQLFVLFGGKVDPMLLATFFEDKGLYNMSQKFEGHTRPLTKTDFIYIISNDDLTDFKTEEEKKAKPVEEKEEKKASEEVKKISKKDDNEQNLMESFFGNYDYVPIEGEDAEDTLASQFAENGLTDDEMSELLSDIAKDGVVEVDEFDHVDSLNELFSLSGDEEEEENQISETSEEIAEKIKQDKDKDPEEIKEFRENLISILDQAKNSYEGITIEESAAGEIEVEEDSLADVFNEGAVDSDETKETTQEDSEDEDAPMWAKFLSPDQMDVMMGGERSEKKKETPEPAEDDEVIEVDDSYTEPVIDDPEPAAQPDVDLQEMLEDRREEFIEVIFKGSEKDYKTAISRIEKLTTWKKTSSFIQKEIFKKNEVDMLDGATVDFTDRLHTYFNELRST